MDSTSLTYRYMDSTSVTYRCVNSTERTQITWLLYNFEHSPVINLKLVLLPNCDYRNDITDAILNVFFHFCFFLAQKNPKNNFGKLRYPLYNFELWIGPKIRTVKSGFSFKDQSFPLRINPSNPFFKDQSFSLRINPSNR